MINNNVRTVVFDFDGVIINSNRMKYDAFFEVFSEFREHHALLKDVLGDYRERTRRFIIERFLRRLDEKGLMGADDISGKIGYYAGQYGKIVDKGSLTCPEIPGASRSLEILSERYPLYVDSTTLLKPLKSIIHDRGLERFFRGVYGGPAAKSENLSLILKKEGTTGEHTVFIGDSESDRKAASEYGCIFVGVSNEFNTFKEQDEFIAINDMENLSELIESVEV